MYVDVDVLYALVRERDWLRGFAESIVSKPGKRYSSAVALLELELIVKREISDELSKNIVSVVKKAFPGLVIKSVGVKTVEHSLALRKKYGLSVFDAVHAAAALESDGRIASSDEVFDRVAGLTRIKPWVASCAKSRKKTVKAEVQGTSSCRAC